MSSIARPSRSISVGIAEPSWIGRRSPAPNCSAAPISRFSGRSTERTVPNEVTAPTQQRREEQSPEHAAPVGRLAVQVGRARRGPGGLREAERPHVAQERVRRAARQVGHAARLVGPAQVGQRVRHAVRHLDLRLVGRDLVDDVAVRRRERPERAVPALIGVGRVAVLDRQHPESLVWTGQVRLRRPDLRRHRGDQAVAEIGALEQQRDLFSSRTCRATGSS